MLVRDLMTPDPLIVLPTDTLGDAVDLMRTHDIRELPGVDDGFLVGILTDRDLKAALGPGASSLFGEAVPGDADLEAVLQDTLLEQPIGERMTSGVDCLYANTAAADACRLLVSMKIGAMPVVDEGRQLVGILSTTDLLSAAAELFSQAN